LQEDDRERNRERIRERALQGDSYPSEGGRRWRGSWRGSTAGGSATELLRQKEEEDKGVLAKKPLGFLLITMGAKQQLKRLKK
jgi:hypothetical protein